MLEELNCVSIGLGAEQVHYYYIEYVISKWSNKHGCERSKKVTIDLLNFLVQDKGASTSVLLQ